MTTIAINLKDTEYQQLLSLSQQLELSIEELIRRWIVQQAPVTEDVDIEHDPVFLMEGYDSDGPTDLSRNLDHYLYGAPKK